MPQLAPMNWLVLFIYFSLLLYLTAVKLYFMSKGYSGEVMASKESETPTMMLKI